MNNLNYGIIGNCKSAALIDRQGSIDWCCLPSFDSPSVFARILDGQNGGCFRIEALGEYKIAQEYLSKTNILVTKYSSAQHAFELIDFMPRYRTEEGLYHCPPEIIRYIRHLSGKPQIRIHYQPRPAYAQHPTRMEITDEFIKHLTTKGQYESVYLYTDLPFEAVANAGPVTIERDCFLLLNYNQKLVRPDLDWIQLEFERTKVYWLGWVAKTKVFTHYQKQVERSSLVLKLLAYQKTGAILAAATTSLPETIGGIRNWDYRYCWIRDASMTITTLARLGHFNVAKRFLQFILDIVPYKDEKIQILYPIDHRGRLAERELLWLAGYENSKPVRVGNAAIRQRQNDIYGVLLDAIYHSLMIFHHSLNNKDDIWTVVRTLARHVRNHWKKPDSSIWEFRTEQKHYTFSKILCWTAMDRAARIAHFLNKRNDAMSFAKTRDEIKANILKKGCDPATQTLTQSYGGTSMDAANLLAQHYGFLSPRDPIYVNTVARSFEALSKEGLMHRYRTPDDFGVPTSSFTICTFWMIKSLYLIGRQEQAREMFERVLQYSNHVGLFSEDMDFTSKRLLGNFPQGYSHIALIDTALTLSESPEWVKESEHFQP
ncbi:MAG: glycoside hydrolase family 15 protein [Sedimentisphaerales bacterium]